MDKLDKEEKNEDIESHVGELLTELADIEELNLMIEESQDMEDLEKEDESMDQ